jgi:hypothetical protein
MALLLERWRGLGAAAATLSVVPTNAGAIAFYESLGFRLTGEEHGGEVVMRIEFEPLGGAPLVIGWRVAIEADAGRRFYESAATQTAASALQSSVGAPGIEPGTSRV